MTGRGNEVEFVDKISEHRYSVSIVSVDSRMKEKKMRDIDTIIDDMERLMKRSYIELDPTAPAVFKKLHIELLEARGFIVNTTVYPKCHQVLDRDQEQGRNWEFVYQGKTPTIMFTCLRCNIEVPLDVVDPNKKPSLN